jgi:hypothetical protein
VPPKIKKLPRPPSQSIAGCDGTLLSYRHTKSTDRRSLVQTSPGIKRRLSKITKERG